MTEAVLGIIGGSGIYDLPGLENVRLPSLILQPILENAIKYAITPRAEGGSIDVSASRDEDLLRIRIEDDGPGMPPEGDPRRRRGVGLANARERLELIYGDRAGLTAALALLAIQQTPRVSLFMIRCCD